MDAAELLAVSTEDVVRAQRTISVVTAALADLHPMPEWPDMVATRCDEQFVVGYACRVAQTVAHENLLPIFVLLVLLCLSVRTGRGRTKNDPGKHDGT